MGLFKRGKNGSGETGGEHSYAHITGASKDEMLAAGGQGGKNQQCAGAGASAYAGASADTGASADAAAAHRPARTGLNSELPTIDSGTTAFMGTPDLRYENGNGDATSAAARPAGPDATQVMGHAAFAEPGSGTPTGKKHPHLKRNIIIAVCSVVGVIAVAYVGVSIFFMSHFGFNTTISGIDCSFKSVEEVESLLEAKAGSYELTILERTDEEALEVSHDSKSSSAAAEAATSGEAGTANGGDAAASATSDSTGETTAGTATTTGITGTATETVEGSQIDLAYAGDHEEVQQILDAQNAFAWPMRLFQEDDTSSKVTFSYDDAKLVEAMNALSCMDNSNAVAPADAYPEFDGNHYVIHDEVPGNMVDTELAQHKIRETISHADPEFDLSEAGCYYSPAVTSTSADLQERVTLLDKYVPFALTYTFTDGSTEMLDGATIFDWLIIGDDGSYTVDNEKIRSWVSDFANRHTTVGHERTFTSVDGNTYTVSGGTYGWSVDQDAEIEAIENMLETKQSETREPHWSTRAASNDAAGTQPDWGDTYIDLNLTTQHMYFVKDGQNVFEADVVTGLPTAKRQTPAGVYYVLEKMRNKTLRGEPNAEGVPEYETPVSYWIRMTWSGVGFHDATWQSSFGGSVYKSRGSHGCINMRVSDVAQLYDLVEVGTPIVSHY